MAEKQHWVPLESNPDVLNKYIGNLGVNGFEFVDVWGLEPELLLMVKKPVIAVMMLYPITEKSKAESLGTEQEGKSSLYFVKQTIGNACGTVAIVHALGNNVVTIKPEEGKPFANFFEKTKDKTPEERAAELESDKAMGNAHEGVAQEGQTQAPAANEKVNTHFIAFVQQDGKLYEMNGSNNGPVLHGDTNADTLLEEDKALGEKEDTALVVKKFMARDPTEVNFTVMALVKKD